jgi:hypothetical protein
MEVIMFAILRGANGRRHEVDLHDDPVTVDVPMRATTIQITMTGSSDLSKSRHVTVALPRNVLPAAIAAAVARPGPNAELGLRLVDDGPVCKQDSESSNACDQLSPDD